MLRIAALEAKIFADAWDAGHFAGLLGQDRFLAVGPLTAGICSPI
jgi:hypothetical protein